jgi:predicted nucleic acid-binding protein
MKLRRHPDQAALIRAGLTGVLVDNFAIYWSEVDHEASLDLAISTGLTAFDAAYLWLARHLEAELVTLDGELQRAFDAMT